MNSSGGLFCDQISGGMFVNSSGGLLVIRAVAESL